MDIVRVMAKVLAELEEIRLRQDEMSAALTELADKVTTTSELDARAVTPAAKKAPKAGG